MLRRSSCNRNAKARRVKGRWGGKTGRLYVDSNEIERARQTRHRDGEKWGRNTGRGQDGRIREESREREELPRGGVRAESGRPTRENALGVRAEELKGARIYTGNRGETKSRWKKERERDGARK